AAEDDGPIGIALEERDRHLPADARQDHRSAEAELRDPQPAARGVVLLARAIPEEAHLDTPVLVDVDRLRLIRRPGDHGSLDAADLRLLRAVRGREGSVLGDGRELVLARLFAAAAAGLQLEDDEVAVQERLVDALDGGGRAAHQARCAALATADVDV